MLTLNPSRNAFSPLPSCYMPSWKKKIEENWVMNETQWGIHFEPDPNQIHPSLTGAHSFPAAAVGRNGAIALCNHMIFALAGTGLIRTTVIKTCFALPPISFPYPISVAVSSEGREERWRGLIHYAFGPTLVKFVQKSGLPPGLVALEIFSRSLWRLSCSQGGRVALVG